MYDNVLIERQSGVANVTINRPDKLNALNRKTVSELTHVFADIRSDQDVRAVVLTGAGDKSFVAGADISEINQLTPVEAMAFAKDGQQLTLDIERLGKPVIAAINGFALGGGCELAMACHLRIASDSAKLGQPEIALGIMPGFGGTQRLVRLCGRGAAMELCLLGKPIKAERALQLGIVNQVLPAGDLGDGVASIAAALAASAPVALHGILDAVHVASETPLDDALAYEAQRFALCCATDDMREGTAAFLEKRKAQFTGR